MMVSSSEVRLARWYADWGGGSGWLQAWLAFVVSVWPRALVGQRWHLSRNIHTYVCCREVTCSLKYTRFLHLSPLLTCFRFPFTFVSSDQRSGPNAKFFN